MHLPRRQFLVSAISAGLVLSMTRASFAQKGHGSVKIDIQRSTDLSLAVQSDPVFSFRAETFKPYIGSFFTAPNSLGQPVPLELLSVDTFRPKNASKLTKRFINTNCFSLMFKASAGLPPFTSIHKVSHPALGEFDLFLTPRTGENGDRFYEAVINHLP
jgi:Domain of unknown function (DUF6916)